MINLWVIFGIVLGVHALVGGILWGVFERWDEMSEWNKRQLIYMICLHGIIVALWGLHHIIFDKLGQPTKFEKAYKNITQ